MIISNIFKIKLESANDILYCPLCEKVLTISTPDYQVKVRCQHCNNTQITFFDVPGYPTGVHFELGKYRFGIGKTGQYYISSGRGLELKYYATGSEKELLALDTNELSDDWAKTFLAFL